MIPSGKLTKLWKDPPSLVGKSTINPLFLWAYDNLPRYIGGVRALSWGYPSCHPVVMDDYDFILKPSW